MANKISDKTKLIIQLLSETDNYEEVLQELHEKWYTNTTQKQVREIKFHYKEDIISLRNKWAIEELNWHLKADDKWYDIDGEDYVLTFNKVNAATWVEEPITIRIWIALVDNMMKDFSRYWNDLTQKQIIKKYNLDPHTWQVLKGRFSMYKLWNVFTDYTYEKASSEEIEANISEAIDSRFKKQNDIEILYDKAFDKKATAALNLVKTVDSLVDYLNQTLNIKPLKYEAVDYKKLVSKNHSHPVYVSSDYHFWEDDDDILEKRVQSIFADMIEDENSEIIWFSLGDYAETFLEEWMKYWQVNRMKTEWFELVQKITNIFVWNIKNVLDSWKKMKIEWQGWNHDRNWKENSMDRRRLWALIIWEMISLSLKEYIEKWRLILNNEKWPVNRIVIEEVKTVLMWNHWDWEWAKKNTYELIALYWNWNDYYNLILEWDKHHFNVDQWTNFIRMITSSIKRWWQYAKDVIYKDSLPGYIKITFDKYKAPNIQLKTFLF